MSQTYRQLLAEYLRKHKRLVVPNQGKDSLCEELHLAYSIGRSRGFTDLGTYVNKPLDHGGLPWARRKPAWAFDLGHKTRFYNLGWRWWVARRLVQLYVKHHKALNIEYVILGNRIWSRKNGWRPYGPDKSHYWHIHVSGHWDGR